MKITPSSIDNTSREKIAFYYSILDIIDTKYFSTIYANSLVSAVIGVFIESGLISKPPFHGPYAKCILILFYLLCVSILMMNISTILSIYNTKIGDPFLGHAFCYEGKQGVNMNPEYNHLDDVIKKRSGFFNIVHIITLSSISFATVITTLLFFFNVGGL